MKEWFTGNIAIFLICALLVNGFTPAFAAGKLAFKQNGPSVSAEEELFFCFPVAPSAKTLEKIKALYGDNFEHKKKNHCAACILGKFSNAGDYAFQTRAELLFLENADTVRAEEVRKFYNILSNILKQGPPVV